MTDAATPQPAALPADPGQALAAGSLDVNALLDVAAAGPLVMIDADLAAATEAQAQALVKARPEIATARALVLLTQECARWYKAYTDETKRSSDYAIEIAHVLDPVVPAQLEAKNRLAAAAAVLVQRVEELEAQRCQIPAPKTLAQLAAELRDHCEQQIALVPQTTDRLAVARDRLTGIIEILGR